MAKNKDTCTLHLPHPVAAIQARIAQAAACEPDVKGNILRYPGDGPAMRLACKSEGDGCTVRISCERSEAARRLRTAYLWGSLLVPVAALVLCTMEVLPWMHFPLMQFIYCPCRHFSQFSCVLGLCSM